MKWEKVEVENGALTRVSRLAVPGGWIYTIDEGGFDEKGSAIPVFVPMTTMTSESDTDIDRLVRASDLALRFVTEFGERWRKGEIDWTGPRPASSGVGLVPGHDLQVESALRYALDKMGRLR